VFGKAIAALGADPQVDAIFCHFFVGGFALNPDLGGLAKSTAAAGKPLFCWLIGKQDQVVAFYREARENNIAVFGEIQRAVECMAAVFAPSQQIRSTRRQAAPPPAPALSPDCRAILLTESGVIDEHRAKTILAEIGIAVVQEKRAATVAQAKTAALALGFPVVMKGLAPGQIHKTEAGLVRTAVGALPEVERVFGDLITTLGPNGAVLIQKQVQGDFELMAGLVRDAKFGPCVMVGMGGVLAELWADTAFAAAPLTHDQALALIGRLRHQKLLEGFRAFAPLDRQALAAIVVALADLGLGFSRIQAIDINPLIIRQGQPIAVDATIVLAG
jgi:acetyltransferase